MTPFGVEPSALFFAPPSSESDDSGSELELDSPSDSEDGFDAGGLTLDLALAFGLGGIEAFTGKRVIFAPERLSLLGCRGSMSERASECGMSEPRD